MQSTRERDFNETVFRGVDLMNPTGSDEMDPAEVKRILRERFNGLEHWILVVDTFSQVVVFQILRKYYQDAGKDDYAFYVVRHQGRMFGVATLRKRKMLAHQYQSILRQASRVRMTERELLQRDLNICTTPALQIPATLMIDELLRKDDETDFSPFSSLPVYDGWVSASRN